MTSLRCIDPQGYRGTREDSGGHWVYGDVRGDLPDSGVNYLLSTFPDRFEVVMMVTSPPADRMMRSPLSAGLPDLSDLLRAKDKTLTRRIIAGELDDVLGHLSRQLPADRRERVHEAIKERTALLSRG